MPAIAAGIDVSKHHLDLHLLPSHRKLRVANDEAGHRQLLEELERTHPHRAEFRIVLEATAGYELACALALEAAGYPVAIVQPIRVRNFAKALGLFAKTDTLDARVLATFADKVDIDIHPLPPLEIREFRELLLRRQQLVDAKVAEKNRLEHATLDRARKSLDKHIRWIEKEIEALDREIGQRVADNPTWKRLDDILQSIPSIGPQTARTIIGQLPELGHVDDKKLAHLVGVAPMADDSGKKVGVRRIVGGRKDVRCVLYMATMSAIVHNPVCKALYTRLLSKGKPKMVAMVAVARKLLVIANAMVKSKTLWRPSLVAETP